MKWENKVGKDFDNLSQRLIYSYIVSYSKFIPADTDKITVEAQKQTHEFFGKALCKVYENPAIIGLPLDKDDYFDWEMFKDKPELARKMKSLEKKYLEFFNFLFDIGNIGILKENKLYISNSAMKLQKSKLTQLERIGLKSEVISDGAFMYSGEYPELCSGFKFLVNICKSAYGKDTKNSIQGCSLKNLMFTHCIFDEKHISWTNLYGDLEQNGAYLKETEEYFISKGYKNIYFDNSFRLHKAYPNKQDGSFSVMFGWRRKNQLTYAFDLPSVRILMEHFDEMDDELKGFAFSRLNNCNSCGYCTQTGKREIVAMELNHNGETINKCPYYANFGSDHLDGKTISIIKKLYDFAEDVLFKV